MAFKYPDLQIFLPGENINLCAAIYTTYILCDLFKHTPLLCLYFLYRRKKCWNHVRDFTNYFDTVSKFHKKFKLFDRKVQLFHSLWNIQYCMPHNQENQLKIFVTSILPDLGFLWLTLDVKKDSSLEECFAEYSNGKSLWITASVFCTHCRHPSFLGNQRLKWFHSICIQLFAWFQYIWIKWFIKMQFPGHSKF